jgi:formylglycine-generating enzyme required for sulfatase activity
LKRAPVPLLVLLLSLSCGDDSETVPDPIPLTAGDTLFVTVEGGSFVTSWGDTVTVETFQLARFEVTNRLYRWLADRGGIDLPPDPGFHGMEPYLFEYPDHPVLNLSAREAERAAAVIGCRLPTAAEWEYAATLDLEGDLFSQYPWGSLDPVDAGFPANFLAGDQWESRSLDGFPYTAPVGSYPLTASGFAELAGNAAEWTLPVLSVCKVKGGSWVCTAEQLLTGATRDLHPSDRSWFTGFRLAR